MRKGSPFTKFFVQAISDVRENGEMAIYIARTASFSSCTSSRAQGEPLQFQKLATLFFMLITGIAISLILFIYENCYKPKKGGIMENANMDLVKIEKELRESLELVRHEPLSLHDKVEMIGAKNEEVQVLVLKLSERLKWLGIKHEKDKKIKDDKGDPED